MTARDRFTCRTDKAGQCPKCHQVYAPGDILHYSENDGWSCLTGGADRTIDGCEKCMTTNGVGKDEKENQMLLGR